MTGRTWLLIAGATLVVSWTVLVIAVGRIEDEDPIDVEWREFCARLRVIDGAA